MADVIDLVVCGLLVLGVAAGWLLLAMEDTHD